MREGIDGRYEAFPLERIDDLPSLLAAHPHFRGLNVTTPHKGAVIPFLDDLSAEARAIGAVNCIVITDGRLFGHNTDWTGFRDSLQPLLTPRHSSALVLGGGGASKAVRYALVRMGIPYLTVSRTRGELRYEDVTAELLAAQRIIINTTVLGTEGRGCPELPYEALTADHLLYDLVYNPAVTPFLAEGLRRGAAVKNGLEMLERQAEASWDLWRREL